MGLLLLMAGFWFIYTYDGVIFGNKRYDKFLERLMIFEEEGISAFPTVWEKGKKKFMFEDKFLYIDWTQKRNKIDIRVYFKNVFHEKTLIHDMSVDINTETLIKDTVRINGLKDVWGADSEKVLAIKPLKALLLKKTNELFEINIPVEDIAPTQNKKQPTTKTPSAPKSPFAELEDSLMNGEFKWEQGGNFEIYKTHTNGHVVKIEKKEEDLHIFTIHQHGEYRVQISYNPLSKEIKDMDIDKNLMHRLEQPELFVSSLEKILFFCYEKTHKQQNTINAIIQKFNEKPYTLLEKEKEIIQTMDYIENHMEELSFEDKHLFESIKNKRFPEVLQLKEKANTTNSSDNEILEMLDILDSLLGNIQRTIQNNHKRSIQTKERLLEQIQKDNK